MSEQQKVAITKKQHLDTAGQMWVDYHMNALRQHMQALGMIEQPQEPITPAIEANHLEEDPVYYAKTEEGGGEMVDDDIIPVKRGKRKPAAKHQAANQPRVRHFITRGNHA
jgi:hypothetical protein